jgi:hypothetical protein
MNEWMYFTSEKHDEVHGGLAYSSRRPGLPLQLVGEGDWRCPDLNWDLSTIEETVHD